MLKGAGGGRARGPASPFAASAGPSPGIRCQHRPAPGPGESHPHGLGLLPPPWHAVIAGTSPSHCSQLGEEGWGFPPLNPEAGGKRGTFAVGDTKLAGSILTCSRTPHQLETEPPPATSTSCCLLSSAPKWGGCEKGAGVLHPLPAWGSEMWHRVRICALQGHGVPAWPSSPFGGGAGGAVAGMGCAESVSPWEVTDPLGQAAQRAHGDPGVALAGGTPCAAPAMSNPRAPAAQGK